MAPKKLEVMEPAKGLSAGLFGAHPPPLFKEAVSCISLNLFCGGVDGLACLTGIPRESCSLVVEGVPFESIPCNPYERNPHVKIGCLKGMLKRLTRVTQPSIV